MSEGFLLVRKPAGVTSFGVVGVVRRLTGVRKVGHSGTLDPFASGLLVVAVGRNFTRQLHGLLHADKQYWVQFVLGISTDTYDCDGRVMAVRPVSVTEAQICAVYPQFTGAIQQTVPAFSAKKVSGKPMYQYARKGQVLTPSSQSVVVHQISHLGFSAQPFPVVTMQVSCSKGTYVRSLAHEIGEALGCGAYVKDLVRVSVGDFQLADALDCSTMTRESVLAVLQEGTIRLA